MKTAVSPPAGVSSSGFLGAFRALGDSLLGTLHDRLELVALELHEEKYRLVQICFWISATVCCALLTVTFASLTLVYLFWEHARLAVLGGLTLGYGTGLVVVAMAFRRYLARQPRPFAATREELQEDRACIREPN